MSFKFSLVFGFLAVALLPPALAVPVLFSANITTQRAYIDATIGSSIPGFALTATGSGTGSVTGGYTSTSAPLPAFTIPTLALSGNILISYPG